MMVIGLLVFVVQCGIIGHLVRLEDFGRKKAFYGNLGNVRMNVLQRLVVHQTHKNGYVENPMTGIIALIGYILIVLMVICAQTANVSLIHVLSHLLLFIL